MVLQLGSGEGFGYIDQGTMFPSEMRLEHGKNIFLKPEDAYGSGKRLHEEVIDGRASTVKKAFHVNQ